MTTLKLIILQQKSTDLLETTETITEATQAVNVDKKPQENKDADENN